MKRKGTQLKYVDRVKLQSYLEMEIPVSLISKKLEVSKQTIYREIKRNSIYKKNDRCYPKPCVNLDQCKKLYGINRCLTPRECERYIPKECEKLLKFPFVCNKCERKSTCRYSKRYYYADKAHQTYNDNLKISRSGIRISQEDFQQINNIISPLIKDKKQSLNHILSSHTEIDVAERTLRNWINNGYTNAKTIDLPRT